MFSLLLSSAYTESRPFLLLTPPVGGLGVHKKLGGDTSGTADPNWPKGYPTPYDVILSNNQLGKEEGRRDHSEWWHLSSQVTVMLDGALLSCRWLNTCLPVGSSEWIPYFALLACAVFSLPIKLLLSQPVCFLTFTILILSPSHCGRMNKWLSGV